MKTIAKVSDQDIQHRQTNNKHDIIHRKKQTNKQKQTEKQTNKQKRNNKQTWGSDSSTYNSSINNI